MAYKTKQEITYVVLSLLLEASEFSRVEVHIRSCYPTGLSRSPSASHIPITIH